MRKFFLIIIIGYFAWDHYAVNYGGISPKEAIKIKIIDPVKSKYSPNRDITISDYEKTKYECDGRQYCSQMNSLEEALFFTKNCPNTKLDQSPGEAPCQSDFILRD